MRCAHEEGNQSQHPGLNKGCAADPTPADVEKSSPLSSDSSEHGVFEAKPPLTTGAEPDTSGHSNITTI